MKGFIYLCFFFVWLTLSPCLSYAQQVTDAGQLPENLVQESVLEKDSILIGDQTWWNMTLPAGTWNGRQIEIPDFSPLPYKLTEQVEALSGVLLDSVVRKRHLESIRARILLTSFDSGSYRLPAVPLCLVGQDGTRDTLWFKGPLITVNTIPVDTTSFEPFGLKPQMRYPITKGEILTLAGLLVLLAALIFLTVLIVRRRRNHRPLFGPARPKDPPHIAALKVLEDIRARELWKKQKAKSYYTLLTDTIRVYLRDRFGIQAMEKTSAQMLAALRQIASEDSLLTDKIIGELEQMFSTGDLAKFAKYTPSDLENEESLRQAIRFVTETARIEEEKKE
ncbi:MAG: hypothetical protein PHT35_02400 [Bacteroidales bacterium]|nr:hypothetical protein [Bacteroidales bacterium]MDD4030452.1 hypothetical protein [Bacteroidales bacterium]MDD4435417.1 hypothetical protein [Bacteroidales bacterium]